MFSNSIIKFLVQSFLLSFFFLSFQLPAYADPTGKIDYPMMTQPDVLIDVGHGGIDSGTFHGSIYESHINLEIGKLTYSFLTERNYRAVLNRTGDYALSSENKWLNARSRHKKDLAQRCGLANEIHPKLMISLHVNSSKKSSKQGTVLLHQNNDQSLQLAVSLQRALNQQYGIKGEAPRLGDTYYLLNHSNVPTVIIEMGFITNASDRKMLLEPNNQKLLAKAIGEGIINYLTISTTPMNDRNLEN